MSKNDGGPAFPHMAADGHRDYMPGISMRDYFAAAALQTMKLTNAWSDNPLYWEGVARSAYVCADAMLAERNK